MRVASSREDAWIETSQFARTHDDLLSRPPARTRGLKQILQDFLTAILVASSREDALIETHPVFRGHRKVPSRPPARTRGLKLDEILWSGWRACRVLPRGRVD